MGSWWRTMRIRQTKLPPFAVRCVSCQEPHRFSQNLESQSQPRRFYYAQLGEPLCHRGTTDPPTPRLRRTSYTDVTDGTFELRHTFVIRHLAFGIFQIIPTESSPQTISPGDPAAAGPLDSTPPRHGWPWELVRPRQQSNKTNN